MGSIKYFSGKADAITCYRDLVLPRRIEKRMLSLLRQNKISKWFSGIGQEAISVGMTRALNPEDVIMTMHRNLGVFTTRKVPYYPLFCQLFGKKDGYTQGRERSFHFGLPEHHIVGMISHLGAMLPVGAGIALAMKMRKQNRVVLALTGDGATSEGDFHEAVNIAAVWKLPIIFLIENNGYGLSTPTSEQYACANLADKAIGYGIEGYIVDGNDIMQVESVIKDLKEKVLKSGPVILEAKTFRMRGHEEASGIAYVPKELTEEWTKKDPILQFENYLIHHKYATVEELRQIDKEIDKDFLKELERALTSEQPEFIEEVEVKKVYAPLPNISKVELAVEGVNEIRFIDGIRNALLKAFDEDHSTLILGQDVAEYGGVFKVTDGFLQKYGKERIRNTPIIESGIIGAAYGLALEGFKPIVEMQFADFISCGFNQIINNLAKSHYRWSGPVNVTIRAPHGAGVGAGPFHSSSPEGWFMQHPGLKIVVPSTVEDAHTLIYNAIFDPNPVLVFEHKKLYRSIRGRELTNIPVEPIGKARFIKEGDDYTIITFGMGVHWALALCYNIESKTGRSGTILDLRSLMPLDYESIIKSVKKSGRVMLLQESNMFMGPLSEVSAFISERCFEYLDAPLMRCSSLDTPIPTNLTLEAGYLASSRMECILKELLAY